MNQIKQTDNRLQKFTERYESSSEFISEHQYLANQKRMINLENLVLHGVRVSNNELIYPLRTIHSEKAIQYQTISKDNQKKLHCSADSKVAFHHFGDLGIADRIIICESLTKAAAIYQAVKDEDSFVVVINAVNAGGMVKCATEFSKTYTNNVTIAADNDSDKSPVDAPEGVLKQVYDVAKELNLPIAKPPFDFKDWDDWLGSNEFAADDIWESLSKAQVIETGGNYSKLNLTDWLNENPTKLLFNCSPIEREFLFENAYIPRGKVTIVPAANGTGKTQLLVQIAIQAALGECFMHEVGGRKYFEPKKVLKVLILSFEDDRDMFVSRVNSTIEHFPVLKKNKAEVLKRIGENLEIIDLPALTPNHLLTYLDSNTLKVNPDQMYDQVRDLINIRGFDLVFVDPMHYTTSAPENDNNQQGQHIRFITNLAEKTDAAVFCFSHTTDENPLRIRGATSIADRARQVLKVATLARLKSSGHQICKNLAKSICNQLAEGENYKNILWFKMDKNSYGIEDPKPFILKRHSDGVIAPLSLSNVERITDETIIVDYINECARGLASKVMIENELDGKLSIKKSSIKGKLQSMEHRGIIRKCDKSEVNALIDMPSSSSTWYAVITNNESDTAQSFNGF